MEDHAQQEGTARAVKFGRSSETQRERHKARGCGGLDYQFEEFQTLFQQSSPSGILISHG